ncbi:MAG: DUF3268 family zinc-finger domain-containing protein [Muribaculaceae bacterium]|nr:DUF3268 family zinc-finger domain-containing protein [Muribaculaceae bacterium]
MARFTPEQKLIFTARKCPYCGGVPELREAREIFGPAAEGRGRYYVCPGCGARVSCHPYSEQPKGRVASARLRALRRQAHRLFDIVWKDGHKRSRYNAYSWLALRLGRPRHLVHMGYFDEDDCLRVIDLCSRFLVERDPERYSALVLSPESRNNACGDIDASHK